MLFRSPIMTSKSGGGATNRVIEIDTGGIRFFKDAKNVADLTQCIQRLPCGILQNLDNYEEIFLPSSVREACDELARLPMAGEIESLNAAVAGSVVIYLSVMAHRML